MIIHTEKKKEDTNEKVWINKNSPRLNKTNKSHILRDRMHHPIWDGILKGGGTFSNGKTNPSCLLRDVYKDISFPLISPSHSIYAYVISLKKKG
jgi:hypothetical protein